MFFVCGDVLAAFKLPVWLQGFFLNTFEFLLPRCFILYYAQNFLLNTFSNVAESPKHTCSL
jgi:hypothetical protein